MNVQSDWTETDAASDAYILHKPSIPPCPPTSAPPRPITRTRRKHRRGRVHRFTARSPRRDGAITAPYTQTVAVIGMDASMQPKCDILFGDEILGAKACAEGRWLCVDDVDSGAGSLTLTCFETPPKPVRNPNGGDALMAKGMILRRGGAQAGCRTSPIREYMLIDDGNKNWPSSFLTSARWLWRKAFSVDAFLVGGGSFGRQRFECLLLWRRRRGGYTKTEKGFVLQAGIGYSIVIGAGGAAGTSDARGGNAGGASSAFGLTANGAPSHQYGPGGNGGSGGAGGRDGVHLAGGTDGADGAVSAYACDRPAHDDTRV